MQIVAYANACFHQHVPLLSYTMPFTRDIQKLAPIPVTLTQIGIILTRFFASANSLRDTSDHPSAACRAKPIERYLKLKLSSIRIIQIE